MGGNGGVIGGLIRYSSGRGVGGVQSNFKTSIRISKGQSIAQVSDRHAVNFRIELMP
jgi:hypothetical protein